MYKITFIDQDIELNAEEGDTVLEIAALNGIEIPTDCGGMAVCGTCHVYIEEGMEHLPEISIDEEELLADHYNRTDKSRLACQCRISGDVKVIIPVSDY